MRAYLSRASIWRTLGPAGTTAAVGSASQGRCARGVETRPALALTAGCTDHHGAVGRGESWVSESDRGNRHHYAGRTHDDADGRSLRRIRTRHATRAH